MNNIDKFLDLLKEEIGDTSTWDINDVQPVVPPQKGGESGSGGGGAQPDVYPLGDQPEQKGGEGEGGNGESGEEEQQGSGGGSPFPWDEKDDESKEGKGGDEKKEKGDKGEDEELGKQLKDLADGKDIPDSIDDHTGLDKSDSTGKDIVSKVYNEVKGTYKKREAQGGKGESGNFLTRVEEFLKEDLDISKIIRRIAKFKREISENEKNLETYDASLFGPVPHQTDIMMKGKIKSSQREEQSAIMFFAADTSGSITTQDYESIMGYLNNVARKFKEKQHGVSGEVYLIEWDTEVHTPIRKWNQVDKIESEEATLRGGGGTDIQGLFDFLNKNFVETDDEGNKYFVFSDNQSLIKQPKRGKAEGPAVKAKLKKPRKSDKLDVKSPDDTRIKAGETNIFEGKFSIAPFLVIYTDGFFSPPSNLGPLFENNPGNVLYIVTSRDGIKNIKPKNFVYHDLHGDDL